MDLISSSFSVGYTIQTIAVALVPSRRLPGVSQLRKECYRANQLAEGDDDLSR